MNDATVDRAVRARLAPRPGTASMAQLALLDHHMVPSGDDVAQWMTDARQRGFRTVRTTALFPESRPAFIDAGFVPIDRLALLELVLDGAAARRPDRRTRRLRTRDLPGAAAVDHAAFGPTWGNDATSLTEIGAATPQHRSRAIGRRHIVAFAITGRAGRTGYIQRLAVHPDEQGSGFGRRLLHDSLAWMIRHRVGLALVNTGVDNERALGLYRSEGFRTTADELVVLERSLDR